MHSLTYGLVSMLSSCYFGMLFDNCESLKAKRKIPEFECVMNGPDFKKTPLVPVIAQDHASGVVLMLAYMNEEAFRETLATGRVCYFSRSRNKPVRKA